MQTGFLKGREVCEIVYRDMHLRYPEINHRGRILYPAPGIPKKHYNGLINQSIYHRCVSMCRGIDVGWILIRYVYI